MKSADDVVNYYQRGALFENLIIADKVKRAHHKGEEPRLYFYLDSNQVEVDLVKEDPNALRLTEIKANRTYKPKLLAHLNKLADQLDRPAVKELIFGGEESFTAQGVAVNAWFR